MRVINVLKEATAAGYKQKAKHIGKGILWSEDKGLTSFTLDGYVAYRIPSEDLPFTFNGRQTAVCNEIWKDFDRLEYFTPENYCIVPCGDRQVRVYDNVVGINDKFLKNFDKNCKVYITEEPYKPVFVFDSDGLCGAILPINPKAWQESVIF